MDWMLLLSTLAGAAVGIAAPLFADRNRWRREEARHTLEVRREANTAYVSALKAVGEAFPATGIYPVIADLGVAFRST
ncbi:hypothetical protein OG871_30095 [Kitasatospora sp. NBC_00374]|uniref:hypothetical protein n=1 Tax=Kitasatospora sp. NBC_00374 TaxID=2975964 RepID=UPI0032535D9F